MRLLIIRHGESEADLLKVCEGRADFNLTEKGRAQADQLARRLAKSYRIDRLYSSPLKRARQTAKAVSEALGREICFYDDLMEFNNGLIAGLPREEADQKYPRIHNLPIHQAVYGQESALEFRFRGERILSMLLSEISQDDTAAVVSHGSMITQLYRAFLRMPAECSLSFHTGDTGLHEWLVKDGARSIVRANCQLHLL